MILAVFKGPRALYVCEILYKVKLAATAGSITVVLLCSRRLERHLSGLMWRWHIGGVSERLTSVLATFPLCVMFLLCFSLAMRILCLATIFQGEDNNNKANLLCFLGVFWCCRLTAPPREAAWPEARGNRKCVPVFKTMCPKKTTEVDNTN